MLSSDGTSWTLSDGARQFDFTHVELEFISHDLRDLFAKKNNKTLRYTLTRPKYAFIAESGFSSGELDVPLGEILKGFKANGDQRYRDFLNAHGDSVYCRFRIADRAFAKQKGLYLFLRGNECTYLGRCKDTYGKRIDTGYGVIHPKNCYIDGQSTNCHVNSLIASDWESVRLFIHPMEDDSLIEAAERVLIQEYQPRWNVALKRDKR